jgi:hypothetical protein
MPGDPGYEVPRSGDLGYKVPRSGDLGYKVLASIAPSPAVQGFGQSPHLFR